MSFVTNQIHAASAETQVEWVQRIVDLITGIDLRITCNTTAAEQYADDADTATFDFNIDNKYILRFTRRAVNGSNANGFDISIVVNETEYSVVSGVRMWYASGTGSSAVSNGYFKVSAFESDDNIFIWFGCHHDAEISDLLPSNFGTMIILDENYNSYCGAISASNDFGGVSLYKCEDGTSGFSFLKPLNYTESVGNISIIDNCFNPIANAGAFATFAKSLIACSTVAAGSSMVIEGKTYFAISTNILEEVSV